MAEPVTVLGVRVDAFTVATLLARIETLCRTRAHALALNVNIHALNLAHQQPWLRAFLNSAPIVWCDGAGVRLGAWLLGHSLPARITYADFMWQLAAYVAPRGLSLYFVGAAPGVAEQASDNLRARYPTLKIVGVHHGYFDKTAGGVDNKAVIHAINQAQPDILVVAFGMPLQERWLMENWPALQAHVALTGGAILDYVSGRTPRGPTWLTRTGFEWLARLLIEPRRLWRRYLIGNPLFVWRVLRQR